MTTIETIIKEKLKEFNEKFGNYFIWYTTTEEMRLRFLPPNHSERDAIIFDFGVTSVSENNEKTYKALKDFLSSALKQVEQETINSISEKIKELNSDEHYTEESQSVQTDCWCKPKVLHESGSFIYVHNDWVDREEIKNYLSTLNNELKI